MAQMGTAGQQKHNEYGVPNNALIYAHGFNSLRVDFY